MVKNFFIKLASFMQDRYGMDQLNTFILAVAVVLYVINLSPKVRSSILILIVLALVLLVVLRALSKNLNKRMYENLRFTDLWRAIAGFFKRRWMRLRDFRKFRYVRCPYCKAQLRLKKRTGSQRIHCPKCDQDFKKNILF